MTGKVCLLILVFVIISCSAEAMSLHEVESYLANTSQFHVPPSQNTDGYEYPVIDIKELWAKLGIKEDTAEMLSYPYYRTYGTPNIELLLLSSDSSVENFYHFLVFTKVGDQWEYSDHFESKQFYEKPEVRFFSDDVFYVSRQGVHGTGANFTYWDFYFVKKGTIKQVLSLPRTGYRTGWGQLSNIAYETRYSSSGNNLWVTFDVKVTGNTFYYDSAIAKEGEIKLFEVKKRADFEWNGEEFVHTDGLTVDETEDLGMEVDKGLYPLFKTQFDAIGKGNEVEKEWYGHFMDRVKDNSE